LLPPLSLSLFIVLPFLDVAILEPDLNNGEMGESKKKKKDLEECANVPEKHDFKLDDLARGSKKKSQMQRKIIPCSTEDLTQT
jgi:hypothetical protein